MLSLKIPYCPSWFSFPSSTFKLFLKQSGWKNHSFPFLLPLVITFVLAVPNVARGCKNVKFRDWLGRACIWLHTDSRRPSLKVCILTWVRMYAHFPSPHAREHTHSTLRCLCGLPLAIRCRGKVCVCSPKMGFKPTSS